MSRIAVIGAGSWGTALAMVAGRRGDHEVRLWAFEKEVCEGLLKNHINAQFLPGFTVPATVTPTNSLQEALAGAQMVVSVMPSHHCRRVFEHMAQWLLPQMLFVSATKGVENDTLLRMSEVIHEVVGRLCGFVPKISAMSGPTFAKEVARGDPTALTVASADLALAGIVQKEFSDPGFRIYMNDDLVGVELGGSLKNVIAIAAGVCDGLKLGHNSIAAVVTRGLAEITRLAAACGAQPQTMSGLAGMGDLVLTCTGGLSRNRSVGVALGQGQQLSQIIAGMHGMVAEGVLTTNAAIGLAQKYGVEMPITEQMYAILHDGKSPRDAIRELMTRPGKVEDRY
ncbi:MAG TPA: NAD(P)H-dependent glycerol-3-phosphate dehydrogenase [Candidatus Saccharimonadales bacterium]|jgi:glycerol-3-phosphate dehydrogenase (NAD(P)+)|nr:NAD(P)H-dependent glycerol-3-phosphate dehydrogenase [Candidatus Saccharimonadales bacterium]